jgi:predicted DNA-binding transcriptional regulator AlpA
VNVENLVFAAHHDANDRVEKGIIDAWALLPGKTLLDESRLAAALQVTSRTARRMVASLELPPPVQLGGRSVWMIGKVLEHIEAALEDAKQEAVKELERIQRLSPWILCSTKIHFKDEEVCDETRPWSAS